MNFKTKHRKHLFRRCLSLMLTLLVLFTVPVIPTTTVSAGVEENIAKLNEWQQIYLRVISCLALKDSYETGIFASLTAGQAIYESGWARYGLSVVAHNQYGIKAYSSWGGKVIDYKQYVIYDSYEDLVRIKGASYARRGSIWRAYDSWDESIADHSALLLTERYEGVRKAKNYKKAIQAMIDAGYSSNDDYVDKLVDIIRTYGFDKLDDVEEDANGVFGLIMNQSKVAIPINGSLSLEATTYPKVIDVNVKWESSNPDVAKVDAQGNVTGLKQGVALITATYNGKEAATAVCVGTNGFVFDEDVAIRSKPSSSADSLGKVYRGMPIAVVDGKLYTSSGGTKYYRVRANCTNGKIVEGYALAEHIYLNTREVSVISTKAELNLNIGVEYKIDVEIAPADAIDKTLEWSSSNESVAYVDQEGYVKTLRPGTATVRITSVNGVYLDVVVNVGTTVNYKGITTANIYVRSKPRADASALGLVAEGTEITLIGEPENGWYHVEATLINGTVVEGYCYDTYIELDDSRYPSIGSNQRERDGYISVNSGSSLNLRATAGTSGKKVVSADNGTTVLILGEDIKVSSESVYKTWYYVHLYIEGEFYEGYVAADFITVTADRPPVKEPDPEDPGYDDPNQSGPGYTPLPPIEEPGDTPGYIPEEYILTDTVLRGVSPETTVAQLREKAGSLVHVFDKAGKELQDHEEVATGYEVRYIIGSTVIRTVTVVVRGDLNADGRVNSVDYMMLKRFAMGNYELDEIGLYAALLTPREIPCAVDYIMLKLYVLDKFEL